MRPAGTKMHATKKRLKLNFFGRQSFFYVY